MKHTIEHLSLWLHTRRKVNQCQSLNPKSESRVRTDRFTSLWIPIMAFFSVQVDVMFMLVRALKRWSYETNSDCGFGTNASIKYVPGM